MIRTSENTENQIFARPDAYRRARALCELLEANSLGSKWIVSCLEHVGGQGYGFSGTSRGTGAPVWIKLPNLPYDRPADIGADGICVANARMDEESRILSLDDCQGFWPALLELGEFDNPCLSVLPDARQRFLVMERLFGETAERRMWRLAQAGASEDAAKELAGQWRRFVEAFQARLTAAAPGMIYVDITPSNFLFTAADSLRVLDAGSVICRTVPSSHWPLAPRYVPQEWSVEIRNAITSERIDAYLTAATTMVEASLVDEYRRAVAFLKKEN